MAGSDASTTPSIRLPLQPEAFFSLCAELLFTEGDRRALHTLPASGRQSVTVWEAGFDSASIVEIVLLVEELGGSLPEDLRWEEVTLQTLYDEYVRGVVATGLRSSVMTPANADGAA